MTFQLPNTASVKEIDRAVELLRTVSRSLHREAEQALTEYERGGIEDDAVGAHRERRRAADHEEPG